MSSVIRTTTPLSPDEARALTDRIRSTAESLSSLLLEAYERRAWAALGYDSWRAYATAELSISQSRAYQLLDHAKVLNAVRDAAGVSTDVEMTEAEARDLKPRLPEVTEAVRQRVEAGEPPVEAVRAVVEEARKEPEPEEWGPAPEVDVHAELAAALEQTRTLQEALDATDQGAEIRRWVEKYARLEGRVQQLLRTEAEFKRQAKYQTNLLREIREALGVERDREILPALRARRVA